MGAIQLPSRPSPGLAASARLHLETLHARTWLKMIVAVCLAEAFTMTFLAFDAVAILVSTGRRLLLGSAAVGVAGLATRELYKKSAARARAVKAKSACRDARVRRVRNRTSAHAEATAHRQLGSSAPCNRRYRRFGAGHKAGVGSYCRSSARSLVRRHLFEGPWSRHALWALVHLHRCAFSLLLGICRAIR